MLFTWFMLGGLIFLFAPRGLTGKLQLGFVEIFRWPLSIGGDFVLTSTEQVVQDTVPRGEYTKLLNHANNLEAKLRQQQEMFKKLSALYSKYDAWDGVDFALAKVITANVSGARNELTINYNRNAPLVKDQFVLRDNSIIGRITDASAGTAHVRLFTDRTSAIPVKIEGLDKQMILEGNGDGSAKIPLVDTKSQIKAGDRVFASDAGNRFLGAPMVIGVVARCVKNRKDPLIWDITVRPVCDIENLEDVTVIIMNRGQ